MYCKELSKDDLLNYGFISVEYDETNEEWIILRNWYNYNTKQKTIKRISITDAVCKHKYTKDKVYKKITFCYKGKGISIPLSRFLYAWFNDLVPAGMDVEHIENDPNNNSLDNLRLCTRTENLAKRFTDNPLNWTNQYGKPKKKENLEGTDE